MAILQFLAADAPTIQIGDGDSQKMVITKRPLSVQIGYALDESMLEPSRPESEEADETVLELTEDGEKEQEDNGNDQ